MKEDLKPERESTVEIPTNYNPNSEEVFAVYLETDDRELLIPFKVYRIKLRGEYVRVIDEQCEVAIYPSHFFLPLQLPAQTINALSSAYVQAL